MYKLFLNQQYKTSVQSKVKKPAQKYTNYEVIKQYNIPYFVLCSSQKSNLEAITFQFHRQILLLLELPPFWINVSMTTTNNNTPAVDGREHAHCYFSQTISSGKKKQNFKMSYRDLRSKRTNIQLFFPQIRL